MAALLLSSCSQEELGEQGTALPEVENPLQIGSVSLTAEVSEQPWTRVSESTDGMSSEFKAGDAITCKGDATIILTGSSSLTAKTESSNNPYHYGSGIYVENGTLTIDGEGSLIISRTSTNTYNKIGGAGIGAGSGANILIESGNIQIGDLPSEGVESGAGIGSLPKESCGDITINGGTISFGKTSWWSACIGSAQSGSCGNITISGESTVITYTQGIHAPCGIGNGERGTCGTVTITGGATVNGTRYYDHTGTL